MAKLTKGIVLNAPDDRLAQMAESKKLDVVVDDGLPLAFDKTLFVEAGGEVPWDLLPAAWHFLERWDAAVPLWRYGVNASDVGTKGERKRTEEIVRDLRVLLHAVELLFVRDNDNGRALMNAYREELEDSDEKRLAFLRAYYQTKPRLCVLPRSWLAKIFERSKMDARSMRGSRHRGGKLVEVEIGPGRFVKCHPGDEEKVLQALTGGRRA